MSQIVHDNLNKAFLQPDSAKQIYPRQNCLTGYKQMVYSQHEHNFQTGAKYTSAADSALDGNSSMRIKAFMAMLLIIAAASGFDSLHYYTNLKPNNIIEMLLGSSDRNVRIGLSYRFMHPRLHAWFIASVSPRLEAGYSFSRETVEFYLSPAALTVFNPEYSIIFDRDELNHCLGFELNTVMLLSYLLSGITVENWVLKRSVEPFFRWRWSLEGGDFAFQWGFRAGIWLPGWPLPFKPKEDED